MLARFRSAILGTIIAASLPLVACTTNPTTGRSQFNALSAQEEIQIGEEGKGEMLKEFGGEVSKAELKAYVSRIGHSLVESAAQDDPKLRSLPWEFFLLDSKVVNAFALPGGKVFISLGLARQLTNEAEIAGVLGHEVGHVAARHTNDRYAKALGLQVGIAVAGVFLGNSAGAADLTQLAGKFGELALMAYGRDQENEADALGMRYMTRASYNPEGQKQVMQLLDKLSQGDRPPEILSTHPDPARRVRLISDRLAREYAYTANNPQYSFREAEYRQQFLSKLSLAFPEGRPEDPAVTRFAMTDGADGHPDPAK